MLLLLDQRELGELSRLLELRKQQGLTQIELARRIGKPQQFVSAYEARVRRLDLLELYAIVKAICGDPEGLIRDIYHALSERVLI